ncbi:uncharacterized protein LOC114750727 [Neltuma alba]|uniref:uncharacterized protein LOC114750727 n=1 Tax=Neltuma alba TaxID=207710 RepID=UPI0010A48774|nr:uncharacterized protein LOC114750727 [Prosopis alba]
MALRVIALSRVVFLLFLSLISFAAILATSEQCTYVVRVKTGDRKDAGTDSKMTLKLKSLLALALPSTTSKGGVSWDPVTTTSSGATSTCSVAGALASVLVPCPSSPTAKGTSQGGTWIMLKSPWLEPAAKLPRCRSR